MQQQDKHEYTFLYFFFQAEDGIRDKLVTGVQTCALPIYRTERGDARGGDEHVDAAERLDRARDEARHLGVVANVRGDDEGTAVILLDVGAHALELHDGPGGEHDR